MPLAFAPPVDRVVIDRTASYNTAIVDRLCLPFVVLQRTASHRIIALGTARLRSCVFRTAAAGQNSLARHFIFRKGSWTGWRSVRQHGSPAHQFRSIVRRLPPPPLLYSAIPENLATSSASIGRRERLDTLEATCAASLRLPFPISGIQLCEPQRTARESILKRWKDSRRVYALMLGGALRFIRDRKRARFRAFTCFPASWSVTETVIQRRFPSRSIDGEERRKRKGFFPDVPLAELERERERELLGACTGSRWRYIEHLSAPGTGGLISRDRRD